MSEPVIKAAFQNEIARVKNNEADLEETVRLRQHAGDAVNAVYAAKIALADAVIAAGVVYTRDDIVRYVDASRQMVWVSLSYDKDPEIVFEETPEQVVDRLTKGET